MSTEAPRMLPQGWVVTPLSTLASLSLGKMLDRAKNIDGTPLPYLRNLNVRWGHFQVEDLLEMPFKESELERYGLRTGDVLVCEGGEPGRAAVWQGSTRPIMFQKAIHRVRPNEVLESQWLVYHLRNDANAGRLEQYFTGTTIKHFTGASLSTYPITLPPVPEQRRIVAKLEALLARSRRAKEALDAIAALLEKFRQSVLAAAFRGDLTADWRAQHPDVEPASKLLERIRTERRRQWEETELRKFTTKGTPPSTDVWKGRYREPLPVETADLPELPPSWSWLPLEALSVLITDGDHNPPKRVPLGVPHLTARNIKGWKINFDQCSYISPESFEQTRARYEPQSGDVIITCVGTVGETAVVPPGMSFSADRNLAAVRLLNNGMQAQLLLLFLNSPALLTRMKSASGATAQPHLYLGDLRRLPIPVPPMDEQLAICSNVAALLQKIECVDAVSDAALKQSRSLDSALLSKAFRGELVPQDPNDEPASVLLERIRAERAASAEAAPKRTRTTRASSSSGKPAKEQRD